MNAQPERLRVQYGAGWLAAPGWLNFDSSPSLWLERLPVIGKLIKINKDRFPEDILFGDIVKGLPVAPGSVASIYASHVLEHLSYDDFWRALTNTYEALEPGGVFRLIVPDLEGRAHRYLERVKTGHTDAASRFLEESFLGQKTQAHSLTQRIRKLWGHSDHLWMWDEPSMTEALRKTGFVDIRRCQLGDAGDACFAAVERADRFTDEDTGDIEVAMECKKPLADAIA
jgi:SAM-dependent methyltransferase